MMTCRRSQISISDTPIDPVKPNQEGPNQERRYVPTTIPALLVTATPIKTRKIIQTW